MWAYGSCGAKFSSEFNDVLAKPSILKVWIQLIQIKSDKNIDVSIKVFIK